jgi:thioredoxin
MTTIELNSQNFSENVITEGITVVDFWAEWCGPCRQFAPIFEEASDRHPDIRFAKVDTEANRELAAQANITSIPTLMVFREGILLYNQPGALPGASLEDLLSKVRELDMAAVHAEVKKNREE